MSKIKTRNGNKSVATKLASKQIETNKNIDVIGDDRDLNCKSNNDLTNDLNQLLTKKTNQNSCNDNDHESLDLSVNGNNCNNSNNKNKDSDTNNNTNSNSNSNTNYSSVQFGCGNDLHENTSLTRFLKEKEKNENSDEEEGEMDKDRVC